MLYNLETSNESEAVIPEIGLSASPRTARNVDETAGATSIPTTRAAPPGPTKNSPDPEPRQASPGHPHHPTTQEQPNTYPLHTALREEASKPQKQKTTHR